MQSGANIQIDEGLCRACKKCLARKVCRGKAIIQVDASASSLIDLTRCFDCRLCMLACPFDAISAQ